MTNDDILRMAEECGLGRTLAIDDWNLRVFAARIRAKTIEECACLCDIREREYSAHTSQTNRGAAIGAAYCAAAIRALGGRKPGDGLDGGHNRGSSQV
jgi:hypothetical protein